MEKKTCCKYYILHFKKQHLLYNNTKKINTSIVDSLKGFSLITKNE